MAASWWWQNPSGAWDFRCELNPCRIQATDPAAYAKMASEMAAIPGCRSDKDWTRLGTKCCGSKFFPWACGASRILEFDLNGIIHCILCERLPEKLDNQIKLQHLEWHEACMRLTPAQILACIPHCVPKANLCKTSAITGISRFNFAQWRAEGEPTLLRAGWLALCKMIAENPKNKNSFSSIVTLCDDLAIENEANPALKTSMIGSRTKAARRRLQAPRQPPDLPVQPWQPQDLPVQLHGANKQPSLGSCESLAYALPPPPDEYQPPLREFGPLREPPPQPPLPREPPTPKL